MSDETTPTKPLSMAEKLAAEAAEQAAQMAQETAQALSQPLRRSDTLGALGAALAKAQGAMYAASRDSKNPFFKSSYASLASVWDACREPLTTNELAIIQPVTVRQRTVIVTTLLVHSSGEWIEERLTMIAQQDTPQAIGSTITYGRRYGLAAMVGVAPADDDGEAGTHTLPRGVKWDKGTGPLQTAKGPSDELSDEPEGAGKAPEPAATGTAPVQVTEAGTPPASAAPVAAGTPPSPKRPLARPNMGTSAPPPPGMKPPARAPGSPNTEPSTS